MIPVAEIAQLAGLFDRYNNALDPFSADCRRAKQEFDEQLANLHATHAADLDFHVFRHELVRQCRQYLRKNRP